MTDTLPWVVRFVDSPEPDRTVRLDLNDEQTGGNVYVRPEGFTLGVGEKEVVVSESMLTEGENATAWRRTNREPVIPLAIIGESVDVAGVLNALARELDRPTNWLEFNPSDHTGEAVFFEVVPGSDFGEVDLDPEEYPDVKGVVVNLVCKPVGVGLEVTGSIAALSNDPATGQVTTLPDIRGDVAAPLNVEASWQTGTLTGRTVLLSTHVNPAVPARTVLQAEAGNLGDNTTVQANDTAMSGAGSNYVRCSFATVTTMAARVSFTALGQQGRFKVLARVRKTTAGIVFKLRQVAFGGGVATGPTKTYGATSNNGPHVLDLGQVTFPVGSPLPPGGAPSSSSLQIEAERTSGAGSLDIDAVILIPVEVAGTPDVRTSWVWLGAGGAGAGTTVAVGWNSEADEVYTLVDGRAGWTATRRGGWMPMVHPGHDNHLILMRHVGIVPDDDGNITLDGLSNVTDITWSYRPHWQYLSAPT